MVTIDTVATGKNIKDIMRRNNFKATDIQKACGFGTAQAIFKWFRGDAMPTIDNFFIIADMFGCTVDDIVVVNK